MATNSFDAELRYEAGNATIPVAEVISIESPTKKRTIIKTTHLKSADQYQTIMAGFKDGGSMKAELSYTKAQCEALDAIFENGTLRHWYITFNDLGQWNCNGIVEEFMDGKVPEDDRITGSISIKLSGKPIWNSNSTPF